MAARLTPIIGLEIHVELNTASKMFCSCANDAQAASPNLNICPICLAHPGTLPVPNIQAIKDTVFIGRALGCAIRELSKFDRKHYFYPDLPKGYQISQYDEPIAEHGQLTLTFPLGDNPRAEATIGITRAHLEEDTAKLTHADQNQNTTLVDFNRAGVPLVEIVTDPDFQTALEAKTFCQELQQILRALKVSDANMEMGQMRCEANVSVQVSDQFEIVNGVVKPLGNYKLNNKVEVKNINSFKAVEKAIEFEINRQTKLIEDAETWPQETRGWEAEKSATVSQRIKENAADYRYFPDPDIPPFHPLVIAGEIALPELPLAKRARFHSEYGFSYADTLRLTIDDSLANFAERTMSEINEWLVEEPQKPELPRLVGAWLTNKLAEILNSAHKTMAQIKLSPENFAEFLSLVWQKSLNSTNAVKLLADMINEDTDADPHHLMAQKGYGQSNDSTLLSDTVKNVIEEFPEQVEQFRAGKEPLIKFLVGQAMKKSAGTLDPMMLEAEFRTQIIPA